MFGVNLMKSRMSKKGKKKAIIKKEKSLTDVTSVTSNVTAAAVVAVQQNEKSTNLKTEQTDKAHQIDDVNKQKTIPQRHR
ncbi:Polycystin-1-related protein [Trichinella spiralis]|uniref:Polycystin-1-related protein n=1 Tax=Trichinella spiralis TaxID=6334 RepID=A0ABR3KHT3_TRISP